MPWFTLMYPTQPLQSKTSVAVCLLAGVVTSNCGLSTGTDKMPAQIQQSTGTLGRHV